MYILALLVPIAVIALGHALAYPNPETVSGNTTLHDPTMCKDNTGKYWLFSSEVGIEILTSMDRVAWTLTGKVWPNGASWTDPYTGRPNAPLWAPDCTYTNGKFYLYYSASTTGSRNSAIFLATSTTGMPGNWTNAGLITSTSDAVDYNAIDPNLLIDNGNWWLSFGSFWTGIKLIQLEPGTGKPMDTNIVSLAQRTADNGALEASNIYKHGGYYYLFTSWDKCCLGTNSTYNIRVGRSSSVTGPYADKQGVALRSGGGTLILDTHDNIVGPGGQDQLTDTDGIILLYHYYNSTGNWLGINKLDFSSGWPVVTY